MLTQQKLTPISKSLSQGNFESVLITQRYHLIIGRHLPDYVVSVFCSVVYPVPTSEGLHLIPDLTSNCTGGLNYNRLYDRCE